MKVCICKVYKRLHDWFNKRPLWFRIIAVVLLAPIALLVAWLVAWLVLALAIILGLLALVLLVPFLLIYELFFAVGD